MLQREDGKGSKGQVRDVSVGGGKVKTSKHLRRVRLSRRDNQHPCRSSRVVLEDNQNKGCRITVLDKCRHNIADLLCVFGYKCFFRKSFYRIEYNYLNYKHNHTNFNRFEYKFLIIIEKMSLQQDILRNSSAPRTKKQVFPIILKTHKWSNSGENGN